MSLAQRKLTGLITQVSIYSGYNNQRLAFYYLLRFKIISNFAVTCFVNEFSLPIWNYNDLYKTGEFFFSKVFNKFFPNCKKNIKYIISDIYKQGLK